jgi:hypothetical protein
VEDDGETYRIDRYGCGCSYHPADRSLRQQHNKRPGGDKLGDHIGACRDFDFDLDQWRVDNR